jgi:gamma-glutamylaminecyclotransferase
MAAASAALEPCQRHSLRREAARQSGVSDAMLLFVYGTLLSGEANHALLDGCETMGPAHTAPVFDLYDCGDYPVMVRGGTTAVAGELYRVAPAMRARLDEFEGHPHLFRRSRIALTGGQQAHAYLAAEAAPARICLIPRGDWRAWRAGPR